MSKASLSNDKKKELRVYRIGFFPSLSCAEQIKAGFEVILKTREGSIPYTDFTSLIVSESRSIACNLLTQTQTTKLLELSKSELINFFRSTSTYLVVAVNSNSVIRV